MFYKKRKAQPIVEDQKDLRKQKDAEYIKFAATYYNKNKYNENRSTRT